MAKLLLTIFSLCWIAAWPQDGLTATAEALPFATDRVVERVVPDELVLEGAVEAVNMATVTAKTSGTVTEINFDVNDFVKEGTVLLRFHGNVNQAGLLRAKAGLSGAAANLVQAEREYQRLSTLFEKKMITASQMDQAKAAWEAAKSGVDADKALVATASESVSDTIVRAPYSGYVVKRFIQLGETANVGTPLFTGMSLDSLRVQTSVPQSWMPRVRSHNQAEVLLADNKRIKAKSLIFFPYADEKSHDFMVRVELPPNMEGVYPGTLVKTIFKIGESKRLLLPAAALVQRGELTAVYVVNGQQLTLQPVLVGAARADGLIEMISGLHAGDEVALDPVRAGQYLQAKRSGGAS
ncbi:MAG: efflux RND transporter periplasmic adaptor subunit [Magnetococcales bacterium]|nr:efflux RND transporter periplasmic adaptor subunit [Magnetococcales bacterium]